MSLLGQSGNSLSDLKRAALINTLRGCQLFAGLPPADLNAVAEATVIKSLQKDEYLFRERDPSHGFYVVQKGAINIHRVNSLGKEQVIQIFRTGQSFAEAALASLAGYPADAQAVEPSQVLLVQKGGFIALLQRQPELALRMLGAMSLHLRALVGKRVRDGAILERGAAFRLPRIGDAADGIRFEISIKGLHIYYTEVAFQYGRLLAEVSEARADPRNVDTALIAVSRALEGRITRVLTGKIRGTDALGS